MGFKIRLEDWESGNVIAQRTQLKAGYPIHITAFYVVWTTLLHKVSALKVAFATENKTEDAAQALTAQASREDRHILLAGSG